MLISCVILFIGCSSKEVVTQIKHVKQTVPGEMLNCKDLPKIKKLEMQSDVALYIVELHDMATDCKSKLKLVKEHVKE